MQEQQSTRGVWGAVRAVISHPGFPALALAVAITVSGSASAQPMSLPGMDLNQHCRSAYDNTAFAYLATFNAFGWKCYHQGQDKPMDLDRACRDQYAYNSEGFQADYLSFSDPYSWYCVLKANYTPASYPSTTLSMFLWKGRKIALRTPDRTTCTTQNIQHIVTGLDKGADFYELATGRAPSAYLTYGGLNSFVALPNGYGSPCGGLACGYVGYTGVEFKFEVFRDQMCPDAAAGVHDSTPYYELGRNYWFYSAQLASSESAYGGSIVTGYAVAMRFLAMSHEGLSGNSTHNALRSQVEGLVDTYRTATVACGTSGATTTPTTPGGSTCYRHDWENTLRAGTGLSGLNSTDLFASFVLRLHRQHGWSFVYNVWQEAAALSSVTSAYHAADNFVIAASRAAGANLSDVFQQSWRWPVSSSVRTQLQSELGTPVAVTAYH